MGILCKIFGHKPYLQEGRISLSPTEWAMEDFRPSASLIELSAQCERCSKRCSHSVIVKQKEKSGA